MTVGDAEDAVVVAPADAPVLRAGTLAAGCTVDGVGNTDVFPVVTGAGDGALDPRDDEDRLPTQTTATMAASVTPTMSGRFQTGAVSALGVASPEKTPPDLNASSDGATALSLSRAGVTSDISAVCFAACGVTSSRGVVLGVVVAPVGRQTPFCVVGRASRFFLRATNGTGVRDTADSASPSVSAAVMREGSIAVDGLASASLAVRCDAIDTTLPADVCRVSAGSGSDSPRIALNSVWRSVSSESRAGDAGFWESGLLSESTIDSLTVKT